MLAWPREAASLFLAYLLWAAPRPVFARLFCLPLLPFVAEDISLTYDY